MGEINDLKVSCWSDLHLDYGYDGLLALPLPDVDVLIIAGDLAFNSEYQERALAYLAQKYQYVLYVPGNHEYEYKDIHEHRKHLAGLKIPNVYVLDDGFIDIQGVRFIGSTLWTDCGNDKHQEILNERIFQHWKISSDGKPFLAGESTEMHHRMLDYVGFQLGEARRAGLQSVVISHPAPLFSSVHPAYQNSMNNEAFYTDLRDFIDLHQPAYWFHGHMHHSSRYRRGQSVVVCNPLGNPANPEHANPKFDPLLTICIPPLVDDGDADWSAELQMATPELHDECLAIVSQRLDVEV
jgi:Icc-related predicted phosphoesterase